ncbi:hypothetical protein AALB39_04145 [Lachnospiraceae bacterium 54-53]
MNLIEVILENVGRDIYIKPSNRHSMIIEGYQAEGSFDGIKLYGRNGKKVNQELAIASVNIICYEDSLGMISFETGEGEITYQGFIKDIIGCRERIY